MVFGGGEDIWSRMIAARCGLEELAETQGRRVEERMGKLTGRSVQEALRRKEGGGSGKEEGARLGKCIAGASGKALPGLYLWHHAEVDEQLKQAGSWAVRQ